MLKKFLIASAAGLLLAACQQQPQMASPPPATPLQQLFVVYFNTGQSDLSPEATGDGFPGRRSLQAGRHRCGRERPCRHRRQSGAQPAALPARAAAVKDALQRNGVPAAAIRSGGLGEQNLPVPTADQVPERRNRSVDIAISRRALMSDKDYCAALAKKWREYSRTDASGPAPQAIAKCDAGDYAAGITTLETILTNDRVVLPSRYL